MMFSMEIYKIEWMIWSTNYTGLEVSPPLYSLISKLQWDKQARTFMWPWNVLWSQRCSSWWDLHLLTSSGIQPKTQKSFAWESVGLSRQSRMLLVQRCPICYRNVYAEIKGVLMEQLRSRWSAILTHWQMLCENIGNIKFWKKKT